MSPGVPAQPNSRSFFVDLPWRQADVMIVPTRRPVAVRKYWYVCLAPHQMNGALEARSAGSCRAHFGGVDAEAETREVRLAQGHAARIQEAPDKEQQERDGGVVFVGDRVDDSEREIQAEQHLRVRHPAGFVPV